MRVLALVASLLLAAVAHAGAESAIRSAFDRYKKAVTARDGAAAAAELDDNTVAYFAKLRTAALVAPDIHNLPFAEKLIVVRLRHELTPDELSALDGRSLLAYAISRGWAVNAQVARLGPFKVEGRLARSGPLVFRKDKAGWKLDLTQLPVELPNKPPALSEDALVLKTVSEASGRPVRATIWQPLAPNLPKH